MRKIFYSIFILLTFILVSGVSAQLPLPILQQPPNGAINVSLFPTFSWSTSAGATWYRLEIINGPTIVFDQNNIPTNSYTLTQAVLAGNTTYNWRVKAYSSTSESGWTAYWSFTTAPAIPAAPNLLAPPNGATNVPLNPLLDWSDVTGAAEYRVQVSTTNTFNTTVLNVPGLTNSAYQVPTGILQNNTTYYWRVNASNSGGTSPWSTVWSFTTIIAPPAAPTLLQPPNGATGISVNVTFDWSDVPGAEGYQIHVATNNTFQSMVFDGSSTTSTLQIPSGTLGGTTQYFWRVRAFNVGGYGNWSSVWNFTTGIAPPAAPVLIIPATGSTGIPITNVAFDWNSVPGATSYRIQISLSSDFGTTFVNTVVTSSQYTHNNPAFAYNTQYFWRVNASNTGGTGQWSQVWNFTTTIAALPAPTLLSPANNAVNVPLTPLMDWTDVSGATGYRIQISTTNSFSSYVLNTTTTLSEYTVPSGILQGYTNYYWRVATINAGGTGANSAAWTFRTVQTFNLNLKVLLEGYYNGSTQVQDTIKVYLAQNTTPYSFKDSSSALLMPDGQIMGISYAQATSGTYYIVVKHRNHIETWSTNAWYFSTGNTVTYDFTNAQNKAYGNNMKQVGSVWVLYGGDVNQDGAVNSYDYEIYKAQFGMWGYVASDCNGDWFVDGYDIPVLDNWGVSVIKPN